MHSICSAEYKAVLTKMSEKIKETPEQKFSAQSLSMAMLGLQKQKSTNIGENQEKHRKSSKMEANSRTFSKIKQNRRKS